MLRVLYKTIWNFISAVMWKNNGCITEIWNKIGNMHILEATKYVKIPYLLIRETEK